MKDYIDLEQSRKLFDNEDNPQIVIDSIWKRHWSNAENNNEVSVLNNLLKNHIRLLQDHPESNNGKERENIIRFIEDKLNNSAHYNYLSSIHITDIIL